MLARLVSNSWAAMISLSQHPKQLGLQAYATYLNTMWFFEYYNFVIIKLGNGVLCSWTMQYLWLGLFYISMGKLIRFLMGITLNLQMGLGSRDTLRVTAIVTHEHKIPSPYLPASPFACFYQCFLAFSV